MKIPEHFCVRTDAKSLLFNPLTRVLLMVMSLLMRLPEIIKVCERCENKFAIPNIKMSRARDLLIQFTPCPHCLFVKTPSILLKNRTGRCLDCSIPFSLVDHHAKGRCERCSRKYYRDKERDKNIPV